MHRNLVELVFEELPDGFDAIDSVFQVARKKAAPASIDDYVKTFSTFCKEFFPLHRNVAHVHSARIKAVIKT